MNKSGLILVAVAAIVIVAVATTYIVYSDNSENTGAEDGMYNAGESICVEVRYTNDLGANTMTYSEYMVTGYENGMAIVNNDLYNTTYKISDDELIGLAFPLVDYMFGMTVSGTEEISTAAGNYECEVWTAGEDDTLCAVYVDIATGNVVQTIQNGSVGGIGFVEKRSLSISDEPIDPFVMTDEMKIKSNLGIGDYVTYSAESTEDGVTETFDTTYTVISVDGFIVGYTIASGDNVVTDTLDVRLFIDMFCPGETQDMIADRSETISTPYGATECTVLSNVQQGYGVEYWISEDNGFIYKIESNRPDGILSTSILKDTSLI